ncbi:MAG: hypothetical protein U0804_24415 [Gemmataceae bacterium]
MTIWLDAHLSPAIASWIAGTFGVGCVPVRDLGLRKPSTRRSSRQLGAPGRA